MPKNGHAPKTLLESLDALVAKHHLLKHPFYQAWTEGKLSKAATRVSTPSSITSTSARFPRT